MGKKIKQVDDYIAHAKPFAQPILKKIRVLLHKAGPKMEEKIKWNVPFFEQKGILGAMAGFKEHVRFGFWYAKLMKDPTGKLGKAITPMMGAKLKTVSDLPPDKTMIAAIK